MKLSRLAQEIYREETEALLERLVDDKSGIAVRPTQEIVREDDGRPAGLMFAPWNSRIAGQKMAHLITAMTDESTNPFARRNRGLRYAGKIQSI